MCFVHVVVALGLVVVLDFSLFGNFILGINNSSLGY
jgi:hypothetical protein